MTEAIALNALETVNRLAEQLGAAESMMEHGYAELAEALLVVQEGRFWEGEYESWGAYMAAITEKHKMGRAQLYHKVAVCRELRGLVDAADLTSMGISKASVLADISRANGTLPNDAIAEAKNPETTVKELKRALAEAAHAPEQEDGEWMDLNFAFYVTAEERAEINDAMLAARQMDPPISNTLKDFMQRKEIVLRFAREFLATYSAKDQEVGF